MDRIEFSKSIKDINITDLIKDHFNEIMILYDLMDKFNYTDISASIDKDIISFSIYFETIKEANIINQFINHMRIPVYDLTYIAQSIINNNELKIQLNRI